MSDRVLKGGARWGERRIRPGGRIKWCGEWWRLEPNHQRRPRVVTVAEYAELTSSVRPWTSVEYDGRLDGRVGLFYRYPDSAGLPGVYLHSMVGEPFGAECVEGVFCWTIWLREGT